MIRLIDMDGVEIRLTKKNEQAVKKLLMERYDKYAVFYIPETKEYLALSDIFDINNNQSHENNV